MVTVCCKVRYINSWGFLLFFVVVVFWPSTRHAGFLVPRPGMEPAPPAVEAQSLNHWPAREVPNSYF